MYIEKEKYKAMLLNPLDKNKLLKNTIQAFLFGGLISILGELLIFMFDKLGFDEKSSRSLMTMTVVLIASLLSAFGIYDKLGQIARAGILIPISGFANGAVSAAMEYKSEGFLLGLSANVFKVVGSVVVLGVFSGFFVGLLKYLWSLI